MRVKNVKVISKNMFVTVEIVLIIIIIITKIYRAPKTINTLRRYLQQLECIVIICKII